MANFSVITGGTGGMGIAIARLLGKSSTVILADINQERIDSTVQLLADEGISALGRVCDMTDKSAVAALAKFASEQGRIFAVVHTAGLSPAQAGEEAILSINMLGTTYAINEFFPYLEDGSSMVSIASMAGYHWKPNPQIDTILDNPTADNFYETMLGITHSIPGAVPNQLAYVISKYFTTRYSKQNVARFGKKGVRINTISPGTIATPMIQAESNQENSSIAQIIAATPISRMGLAEEIANTVEFLTSDKASYITGADFLVDGGSISAGAYPQV